MSAEIRAATGIESELIAGGGGVFDIRVDDRLLFSKHREQRFPEAGEAAAALAFDSAGKKPE